MGCRPQPRDGRTRQYLLRLPPGKPAAGGWPLVVVFHGGGGNAFNAERTTGFTELGQKQGFAVLYPEQDRLSNPQGCWNWFDARSGRAAAEAATVLGGLATLARRQSRFDEALAFTAQEIAWRQAHVPGDAVNLVNALQNRGVLLVSLARYDEATGALQTALAQALQAESAGSVDLFGHLAALRETLSGLLLARGQPEAARQLAADAVQRMAALPEARTPRAARPLRRLADAQLAAFTRDPANKGKIMDRGLWSWTRHPNYFGDAMVTWGVWLVAAAHWPGVLTVLSPVFMTVLLVRVSGAKLLEQTMGARPGYADYIARTSGFLPRAPRRP